MSFDEKTVQRVRICMFFDDLMCFNFIFLGSRARLRKAPWQACDKVWRIFYYKKYF